MQDTEKSSASSTSSSAEIPSDLIINGGRPDIKNLLKLLLTEGESDDGRTIVGACGPESMMRDVRATVASEVGTARRSVRLHAESFGW